MTSFCRPRKKAKGSGRKAGRPTRRESVSTMPSWPTWAKIRLATIYISEIEGDEKRRMTGGQKKVLSFLFHSL